MKENFGLKENFIEILKKKISPDWWKPFWFVFPFSSLIFMLAGICITSILAFSGVVGAPRGTQLILLISIISSPFLGMIELWCFENTGFSQKEKICAIIVIIIAAPSPLITFFFISWAVTHRFS